MNREIKFRAWNEYAKQMRDVPLLHLYNEYPNHSPTLDGNFMSLVYHPKTVLMQFTGLTDRTGKEIYEGDVVKIKFRDGIDKYLFENGVIKWNQKSSAFKWFAIETDSSDENNYWLTHADNDGREVIGNIYENPELLEAKS